MRDRRSAAGSLARGALSLVGAGLGYLAATLLLRRGVLGGPINLVYLTLLGTLLGYLLSAPLARRWAGFWEKLVERARRVPPDAVLAALGGTTMALVITVLLNSVLEGVPGFTWYLSLLLTLVLVVTLSWFFVANRTVFASRGSASTPTHGEAVFSNTKPGGNKVIDTSAIIDGRITDVVEANFIDGTLLVPNFVLLELQGIADAGDPLKRKRGRRGLEVLDTLVGGRDIKTEVCNDDYPDLGEVDEKLIRFCQDHHADLITTDYNLNRVANLHGVRVLNVNRLANALRAVFLPGERLALHIVKAGREPGQGLAYLEDGTMIVVEDSGHLVGSTVDAVVTSNLQTNMGRMIFARLSDHAQPFQT